MFWNYFFGKVITCNNTESYCHTEDVRPLQRPTRVKPVLTDCLWQPYAVAEDITQKEWAD